MFDYLELDRARKLVKLFDEPVILHCHHYNLFLQQTIDDPSYIDGVSIQQDSSQEINFQHLSSAFEATNAQSKEEKFAVAAQLFKFQGFGWLEITGDAHGGVITLHSSHYAQGWRSKYSSQIKRQKPVCHFAVGFAAALFDVIFADLGHYVAIEEECSAVTGKTYCIIRVSKASVARKLQPSPKMGVLINDPITFPLADTSIDYDAVNEALWSLPLEGDEDGLIRAFNVLLTRMPANYYTRIQYRFLEELSKVNPQLHEVGQELIRESGHVCVFYTFGNIMESVEWDTLIKPMIQKDTDWVHGGYAVGSSLGWGRWQALEVESNAHCKAALDGNYESNYYLASYEPAFEGSCYFAQGAVPALMNLVYNGNIEAKPVLDEAFYNLLFKRGQVFHGQEVNARERGADYCTFVAHRD